MNRPPAVAATVAAALFSALAPVCAQSTDEATSVFRLSLAVPGARTLGAGGAFAPVAGDASAGIVNPAALMLVPTMEAQLEGRGSTYSTEYIDGGSATFQNQRLDLSDATTAESSETLGSIAAGSFARPSSSRRWAYGGSYSRPVDYQAELSRDGLTLPGEVLAGATARMDLHVERLGASVAGLLYQRRRGPGRLHVGGTLFFSRLSLSSRTERLDNLRGAEDPSNFVSTDAPAVGIVEAADGCCQFENRGDVRFYETQRGDDNSFGYVLGALWEAPRFSVGATYRRGARFEFQANSYERRFDTVSGTRAFVSSGPWDGIFKLPDALEIGGAYMATERLRFAASIARVEYADLTEENLDLTGKDNDLRGTRCAPDSNFPCQGLVGRTQEFVLRDSREYRVGVEFDLPSQMKSAVWSLRAGAWLDPDHRIRYDGVLADQQAAFTGEDDELHATVGVGVRTKRYRFDVGIDYSNPVQVAAASVTMEFGGRGGGS